MDSLPSKEYLAIAFTYGVSVAALYLFGFWGVFQINVMEFVSIGDVAKLSIYPLLYALPVALLGFILVQMWQGDSLPPGGGADTSLGQFGRKHWRILVSLISFLILNVMLFAPYSWGRGRLLWLLMGLLSIPFTHLNFIISYVPNPRLRAAVLFVLFLIPVMSFTTGEDAAHRIKDGHGSLSVDTLRSNLDLTFTDKKPVSYVGYLGDFMVLYETATDRIVFVKLKDNVPLVLQSN